MMILTATIKKTTINEEIRIFERIDKLILEKYVINLSINLGLRSVLVKLIFIMFITVFEHFYGIVAV